MSDDMVPRNDHDEAMTQAWLTAARERDEARAQVAAVRAWLRDNEVWEPDFDALRTIVAAATPPAPSPAEEAASVLDAEAARWDEMNGMIWCSMVGRTLHRRADTMREEAKK